MDKNLASIFDYFAIFDYFPSLEDVYTFFPQKISKKQLKTVYEAKINTVGEYSKKVISRQKTRKKISESKINSKRFRLYLKLISLFPQIKLVGLSGSISMFNANKNDDIDLFIISAKKRLFTARFISLFLAQIFGLRRKRNNRKAKDQVCLNLFFDERDLKISKAKQSIFVGHEVLQMKPIVNKNGIYEKFLKTNDWVFKYFPNSKMLFLEKKTESRKDKDENKNFILNLIFNKIEAILKNLQLRLINKHKTSEIITGTQLWFHPKDFIVNIKRAGIDA